MGTKQQPCAFDCHAAALPDEPMFVLLARDPLAPELVDRWANARAATEPVKAAEASACAQAMAIWRQENDGRWRTEQPGPPAATEAGEQSSAELASLAGQVLADPEASAREKRLAGSVLTQFEARSSEVRPQGAAGEGGE